jgi:hypothetical protein
MPFACMLAALAVQNTLKHKTQKNAEYPRITNPSKKAPEP